MARRYCSRCSFCRRDLGEVALLAAYDASKVSICDRCVTEALGAMLDNGTLPAVEQLVTDNEHGEAT